MYSTCLFCNGNLGRNEAVEHFPIGRRLAFDAATGRLWVVCRKCERWNLTPLEERWEAIEECERAFSETRLRVSTDQIGLARLKEGLELVRIGEPHRPEMAAWRYGDQFGRRRRRKYLAGGGALLLVGTVVVAGPMLGIVSVGALSPAWNLVNGVTQIYRAKKLIAVPGPDGMPFRTRLSDVDKIQLVMEDGELRLSVPAVGSAPGGAWWRYAKMREMRVLTGDAAVRAAGALLPNLNRGGGSVSDVQRAVSLVEEAPSSDALFKHAAESLALRAASGLSWPGRKMALKRVPLATRLALEMAAHEESERRALEGELAVLEEAWRQADEIAAIADDMFVPKSVDDELARLKHLNASDAGGAIG
ncbi:MAG: hypothetical protein ABIP93_10330 [Gemmatimonadaceae bacterium]